MRLRMGSKAMLVVSDPAEATKLLKRGGTYLHKSRDLYAALEVGVEPRTPNLLTDDDGPMWKAVRNAVAPAFSATSLKQVLPRVVDLVHRSSLRIESAGPGGEVDVADVAKKITSDVMGTLLFGEDLGGVDGKPSSYMQIFNLVLEATHARFMNPLRPIMALWDSKARAEQEALAMHDRLMSEKLDAIKKSPPPDYTITGHLLKVIDPNTGTCLDDARLKAEIAIVFGAGFETTSHAISWTLASLAAHPECQTALAQELGSVGLLASPAFPTPRDFEWSDGARLPYLSAVIRESLRLWSPGALGTTRYVDREIEIAGHPVPKGTIVMVSPYVTSYMPSLYGDDVGEFRPERWMSGANSAKQAAAPADDDADTRDSVDQDITMVQQQRQGQAQVPPDPFPFSVGPRDCVGQSLAMLELQAVVAMLVGRFKFNCELRGAAELRKRASYHVTLQPEGGKMMLRATPRSATAAA